LKRGLALFDFDGTITTKDTLFEIIKFQKGSLAFYLGMIWLSPFMVLFKLKLISAKRAKENVLSLFFANQSHADFQKMCDRFISEALPALLREEAVKKIQRHIQNNDRIVVVTASPYQWVEGWCHSMKMEIIATRLQIKDGMVTGKLDSLNCNDEEKVNRIKEYLKIDDHSPVYAYGNSSGDKPMLALASFPFYKRF
jgi:phosphatidylglycerophosphatase C